MRKKEENKRKKNDCQRFLDVKIGNRENAEPKSSTLYKLKENFLIVIPFSYSI